MKPERAPRGQGNRTERDLITARTVEVLHPSLNGGEREAERNWGDNTEGILPVLNSCFLEYFVHPYLMLSTDAQRAAP